MEQDTHTHPAHLFHSVERFFVGRFFYFVVGFALKVRVSEQGEREIRGEPWIFVKRLELSEDIFSQRFNPINEALGETNIGANICNK